MKTSDISSRRIAVIGAGGVGGYISGMLGRAFSHFTMVLRGPRMESVRRDGFTLHSDHNGEMTIRPERVVTVDDIGEQDVIFICVKNYSLDEVCRSLRPHISDDTIIVPVMNGVDPGDRVRRILGRGIVVDSLIYIIAFAGGDYSVTQQGDFATVKIGKNNASDREIQAVADVDAILTGAGIDHAVAEDIDVEIWRKYILNCGYNVATAYYNNTIGQLREDPDKAAEFETLLDEARRVAQAKGVGITQAHVDDIVHKFYHVWAYDASSSLQRDVSAGKTSELETFSGYIVREAQRLGVDAPVSERMYEGLKKKTGEDRASI